MALWNEEKLTSVSQHTKLYAETLRFLHHDSVAPDQPPLARNISIILEN